MGASLLELLHELGDQRVGGGEAFAPFGGGVEMVLLALHLVGHGVVGVEVDVTGFAFVVGGNGVPYNLNFIRER